MAKVTSKLQVTVPKSIADQYGIRPGDDIDWIPAGDAVRVRKAMSHSPSGTAGVSDRRLDLFDLATQRQKARQARVKNRLSRPRDRGWRRADLYIRDGTR